MTMALTWGIPGHCGHLPSESADEACSLSPSPSLFVCMYPLSVSVPFYLLNKLDE